jgi:dethiobiotin synthetase
VSVRGYFIAGTDTGVGKTVVACTLLAGARADGLRAVGMKPVAAGCRATPEGLRNDDAEALQRASSGTLPYEAVNPCALPEPLSPHLAAARADVAIDIPALVDAWHRLARDADVGVVEGAGGWLAPVSDRETMADLARALGLPVILVVGLRLGCLNHAQLTARAIAADGLKLAGWIGNPVDPHMAAVPDNVDALERRLAARCLGVLPWSPAPRAADLAGHLRLP